MKVFVSCTTSDLGSFRDVIGDNPHEWWGSERDVPQFRSMNDAKAEAIPPVDWSIREAVGSDMIVLLLGRQHGCLAEDPTPRHSGVAIDRLRSFSERIDGWASVEDHTRFSYTQWEVLAAVAQKVPILIFSPDRRSKDNDLRPYWDGVHEQEGALQHRHELFCQWIRSRSVEDHFQSRADLLNKVRAAVKRQQMRRGLRRAALAILLLLLAASAAAGVAYHQHREAVRQEHHRNQTRQVLRQKLGVALGSSMAMLRQSSTGAARAVFERSLSELGVPANQVRELCQKYSSLDGSVRGDHLGYDDFQRAKANLQASVLTQVKVMVGERPVPYVKFGYDLTHLLLLLRFWEELPARSQGVSTAKERLESLQSSAGPIALPAELARKIQTMDAATFSSSDGRKAAMEVVETTLRLYDMQPSPQ